LKRITFIAAGVVLASVVAGFAPALPSWTESIAAASRGDSACPQGTVTDAGLCVGTGDQAKRAAELTKTTFQTDALGAVILGVWKDGKPLLVGALGDSQNGVPATVDMHHRTGNISSTVLTTVLLEQVDAHKLALSDKLSKWYPNLPDANEVTVQMLTNGTAGYNHYPSLDSFQQAFYANPFRRWNASDVIAYGVAGGPLFTPGTNYKFSDTSLLILSQVLEKATHQSMFQLIKKGVLEPLGMTNTTPPTPALPEPILHSYTNERGVWEDATFWDPSWTGYVGGLGSNQDDIRRFIEAVGTGKLLSKASHQAQLAPTTASLGTNTPKKYYAMGIAVVNGWLFTNPNLQGYSGAVGYLPSQKLTIVIYNTRTPRSNPDTPQATQLFEGLSAIFSPNQQLQLG